LNGVSLLLNTGDDSPFKLSDEEDGGSLMSKSLGFEIGPNVTDLNCLLIDGVLVAVGLIGGSFSDVIESRFRFPKSLPMFNSFVARLGSNNLESLLQQSPSK
jgi:hypothetical protein